MLIVVEMPIKWSLVVCPFQHESPVTECPHTGIVHFSCELTILRFFDLPCCRTVSTEKNKLKLELETVKKTLKGARRESGQMKRERVKLRDLKRDVT